MKLVRYEWKKMMSGKSGLILLAFLILNFCIYYVYLIPTASYQQQEKEALSQSDYVQEYNEFIEGLKERATMMKGVAIFNKEGGYASRNIEKTVNDFSRVEGIPIEPMVDSGMEALHNFYLSDVFMLILVCLFCFQGCGKDFKSGMSDLIRTTPKGKVQIRLARVQAVIGSVVLTGILLYGSNLLITQFTVGFGNLSGYVQGMPMFRNMSFPCTVGMYLLLFLIWKLAALVFSVLVIQFLTAWFGGQGMAWALSGIVLVVSFGLWFFLPDRPMVKLFRYLNPVGLLDVRQIIGNYQNLNIFQYPVGLLQAAILFVLFVGLLLLFGTILIGEREYFTWKIALPARKKERLWKHLFSYESYKVIVCQKAWCIYVVFLILSVMTIQTGKEHIGAKEYYYEKYITEYAGDYTENKAAAIERLMEEGNTEGVDEGEALEKVYEQAQYLQGITDKNKGFVNLRTLELFFFDTQTEIQNTLFIVIAIMLSVSNLFYFDSRKGLSELLQATPNRKNIHRAKYKLALLSGVASTMIIWGITYIKYFHAYGINGTEYSIHSIPALEQIPYSGSILSYMIISMLLRLIIGMLLGLTGGIIAQLLIVPTQNVIGEIVLFIMPLCLSYVGNLDYENALVIFINRYLQMVLKPVQFLASLPVKWYLK